MDDSDFPRTPDRPVKLLGTRVRYQRSVETSIGAHGPDFLGGSATQARFGHNLWLLPHRFPDVAHPGDRERLVEDFFSAANSIAFNTLADDVVSKLFSGP